MEIVPDSEEERNTQPQSQDGSEDPEDPGEDYGNYNEDFGNYDGYISKQELQEPESSGESEHDEESDNGRALDQDHNDATQLSDPYNPSDLGAEYDRCMAAEAAELALDPHANDSGEDSELFLKLTFRD